MHPSFYCCVHKSRRAHSLHACMHHSPRCTQTRAPSERRTRERERKRVDHLLLPTLVSASRRLFVLGAREREREKEREREREEERPNRRQID